MIMMLAPAPGMTFSGMPSGTVYVSNQYSLIFITNGSVADQNALTAADCQTLVPSLTPVVHIDGAETITGVKSFPAGITGLPTPVNPTDAADKAYVDAGAAGYHWVANGAAAATTGALPANTYANGTAGVGATLTGNSNGALAAQDGVTLSVNQRLLVLNEAAPANNGLYALTQVGGASTPYILTRTTDANTPAQLAYMGVLVAGGTVQAGYQFTLGLAAGSITIGTTALAFGLFTAAGGIAAETAARQAAIAALTLAPSVNLFLDPYFDFVQARPYLYPESPAGYLITASNHINGSYDASFTHPLGTGAWEFNSSDAVNTIMGFDIWFGIDELASLGITTSSVISIGATVLGTAGKTVEIAAQFFGATDATPVGSQVGTNITTGTGAPQVLTANNLTVPASAQGIQVYFASSGASKADFHILELWAVVGAVADAGPPGRSMRATRILRDNLKGGSAGAVALNPDSFALAVPAKLCSFVGHEFSLYLENLRSGRSPVEWRTPVTGSVNYITQGFKLHGPQLSKMYHRLRYQPVSAISASFLTVQCLHPENRANVLSAGVYTLACVDPNDLNANTYTGLFIGASVTASGLITDNILQEKANNPSIRPTINLIGSVQNVLGVTGNNVEAFSGWKLADWYGSYQFNGGGGLATNHFMTSSVSTWSVSNYLTALAVAAPNFVHWGEMAYNDLSAITDEVTLASTIAAMIEKLQAMIGVPGVTDAHIAGSWLSISPSTKHFISLLPLGSYGPDAAGESYHTGIFEPDLRRNYAAWNLALINAFTGVSGVYLVAANVAVSPFNYQSIAQEPENEFIVPGVTYANDAARIAATPANGTLAFVTSSSTYWTFLGGSWVYAGPQQGIVEVFNNYLHPLSAGDAQWGYAILAHLYCAYDGAV